MNPLVWLIVQCVLGAALGLWLHFLKKAVEYEKLHGTRITVKEFVTRDPKESTISIVLAVVLIIGLPEATEIAQQVAWQTLGLKLPALQRSFFLCAILGGFGNSLADIAATYFGGERLRKFVERS